MMGGEALNTALFDRLSEIIDKEKSIYDGILELARKKTDVIVEGKVSELEEITKLEQSMILKLGKLEEEREQVVSEIARQNQAEASGLTLEILVKMAPEPCSKKLRESGKNLENVIKELSKTNTLNSKLIKSSLDYIDFSINVLTGASSAGETYGSAGLSNEAKKRNFFDMKL